jgi:putative protease
MSSVHGGNSGNRGRCSQPCRDQYITTPAGKNFPLNLKDNSAYSDLEALSDAGVDSIKIEGRIKKFHYVYTVVDAWRKQLISFYKENKLIDDDSAIRSVFNRDFTNAYLKGEISRDMFIDNPRDNSAIYLSQTNGGYTESDLDKAKGTIYDERTEIISTVEAKIAQLSTAKVPLQLKFSGKIGSALKVSVTASGVSFELLSEVSLSRVGNEALTQEMILKRLKVINDTEYYIEQLDLKDLQADVYLPFSELTSIKKRLLFILNGSREYLEPIKVPVLKKMKNSTTKPSLAVLISSTDDINLFNETGVSMYFQLPECFAKDAGKFIDLFKTNKKLIPWFPSVLIGEDYTSAVELLEKLRPERIVTNNSGIAFTASKNEIQWIAGPEMNTINSFSLLSLKENFNCSGAFISNEISKMQMHGIKKPEGFELYYSIFHPIRLMTSRQCLFHHVTGCIKEVMDEKCIPDCARRATITNLKDETFVVEKSKGNYNAVYNKANFLNLDISTDLPGLYSGFMIDLRDNITGTKTNLTKTEICRLFEKLIDGNPESKTELEQAIFPSTNVQYKKGI